MGKIDNYQHFVCIVAGEQPESLMTNYDKSIEVPPYAVYKYSDAEKIKNSTILTYEAILKSNDLTEEEREDYLDTINYLKGALAHDIYCELTSGMEIDKSTGDAISRENPNGKWSRYSIGKMFSNPFKLKDGTEAFQAKKGDIDWTLMHNYGGKIYERAWEMVMEDSKPENEQEENIYENMKNRTVYFNKFGSKEMYVASNIAFWGYAFLSEETKWVELEDDMNQFIWMTEYYDKFIKDLPDDTLLTVIECVR